MTKKIRTADSEIESKKQHTGRDKPVRLRDIAELAGVHVTAVSAVLSPRQNTRTRVSETTAKRIRELAQRLNYRPHMAARMMRNRRTGIIGILEYFYTEVGVKRSDELAKMLRDRGYHVLRVNAQWYETMDDALDYFLNSQVEGVIFVMVGGLGVPQKVFELQQAGIACVGFNGIRLAGIPQVRTDMELAVEMLTNHLLAQGYRRLALLHRWSSYIQDDDHSWPTLSRQVGFERAVLRAGGGMFEDIVPYMKAPQDRVQGLAMKEIPESSGDARHGYALASRLFKAGCFPEALICSNDRYALGAMRACYEWKLQIPKDIAVVGMNGEKDTEYYSPPLTTVDMLHPEDMEMVIDLLFRLIRRELPMNYSEIIRVPGRLLIRESCGAALKARSEEALLPAKS